MAKRSSTASVGTDKEEKVSYGKTTEASMLSMLFGIAPTVLPDGTTRKVVIEDRDDNRAVTKFDHIMDVMHDLFKTQTRLSAPDVHKACEAGTSAYYVRDCLGRAVIRGYLKQVQSRPRRLYVKIAEW